MKEDLRTIKADLDHFPIKGHREMVQVSLLSHALFGKPVSTFPGHALGGGR
jgi:hypothetical protein